MQYGEKQTYTRHVVNEIWRFNISNRLEIRDERPPPPHPLHILSTPTTPPLHPQMDLVRVCYTVKTNIFPLCRLFFVSLHFIWNNN